jgi:ribosomal protein S25
MNYPVGSQYADMTGKGTFAGIADEILNIGIQNTARLLAESELRQSRALEMREYVRDNKGKPSKRMTIAMNAIVQYITEYPGVERAEILKEVFNYSVISPSSLGSNLNYLVKQNIITSHGRTTRRKFYVVGADDE